MRKIHVAYCMILLLQLSACNQKEDSKYIFDENFEANLIGWPEESTSSHETEIRDGYYFINSKSDDTTKFQSSVSPSRTSFLFNLPKHYEITTFIHRLDGNESTEYGITLTSPSLSYRFALTDSGTISVSEYDYNTELENTIIDGRFYRSNQIGSAGVKFTIRMAERNLRLYLNDKFIGEAKVKAKQWDDIRIFTSTHSAIKVDYLRIQKLEQSKAQ